VDIYSFTRSDYETGRYFEVPIDIESLEATELELSSP
jgi:hypothetical protein